MTTALMPREVAPLAAPVVTNDQLALITKTVAQGATPDELKLYLYDCASQGVHPLDKLIHFTKRNGKYTPITSIDFMRIQAHATGECLGISDPIFAMNQVRDTPYPDSATVTVKRIVQGQVAEFAATARWSEYYPGDGNPGFMWRKMPHTMLGKCAEALALRKGFPKQLAGLYAREEMDQAGTVETPLVTAPQPSEAVNQQTGETQPRDPKALYIESCTALSGKKAGAVKFSDGVEATVWASDGKLFDLAVAICQEGKPVTVTLQPGKGNYGPTLKKLSRVDADHDQRREPSSDWTQDVPPVTDQDVPF